MINEESEFLLENRLNGCTFIDIGAYAKVATLIGPFVTLGLQWLVDATAALKNRMIKINFARVINLSSYFVTSSIKHS